MQGKRESEVTKKRAFAKLLSDVGRQAKTGICSIVWHYMVMFVRTREA